ncbi:peptidoglycan-binding domain-containing protein [Aurantimonas coralicida]|uniref:peptidoglycan-binding domain-containing protein n=1 Tax=Aurantimonas coralicida TaxID=182270 RepID=UPI001E53612C|nr:peptidoglycan-binding domain-containing protein [Aurantimonas coralicida]MCD1645230.1 peptidoglycan-binding protein [Aurantimonas coralicida]
MSDTLKAGETSLAVYRLQVDLAALGYLTSRDEFYGPSTTRAVTHFQETHGLPMTGAADPQTVRRIKLELQERTRQLQGVVSAAGQVA